MLYPRKLGLYLHRNFEVKEGSLPPWLVMLETSEGGDPLGCTLREWHRAEAKPTVEEVETWEPEEEAAFAAGGFQVIEPPPQPELPPLPPPPENPLSKSDALNRLKKLKGKTVGTQLDEMRDILSQFFESMPG